MDIRESQNPAGLDIPPVKVYVRQMRKCLFLFFFTVSALIPLSALQADPGAALPPGRSVGFSLAPVFSLVTGRSHELVMGGDAYETVYISKLVWELNNTVNAGMKGSINWGDFLFFNIAGTTCLSDRTGRMNDFDWLYYAYPQADRSTWTNWSVSDIYLTGSYQLDYNTTLRLFRKRNWSLDTLAGFKMIHWSWTDILKEIEYTYESSDYSYLKGSNGIDYEVFYRIPYLGGRFSAEKGKFQGSLSLLYSPRVSADDYDHHILRGLHFYDYFDFGTYFGLAAVLRYRSEKGLSFSFSFDWDEVFEIVGDAYIYRESSGGYTLTRDSGGAGISYFASSAGISLEYNY